MSQIQMIVFDVAGTTLNDEQDSVAQCLIAALAEVNVDAAVRDIDPVMGIPKRVAIHELLAQSSGQTPSRDLVERVHEDFLARMVRHYREHPGVSECDGVGDLFRTMTDAGIRVSLDTGFDRVILDEVIHRLGWSDLIADSIASDEVERGRPHPDMIRELMRRAGITDPQAVCKVGDSVSDIEEGLNGGCGLVAAIHGPRTDREIERNPDVVGLQTITDLLLAITQSVGATGSCPTR